MSTKRASAAASDLLRTMMCHRATLVSVANRILACRQQAEDVVQDAALKACQMEPTALDSPLSFSCCMVRNLAIDRLRRCQLEQRHAAPLAQAEDMAAPLENPHRALEHRQALQCVLRALAGLPSRTRLAFVLNRIHDVPQKDIAASLGVSPTLVHFMIREAQEHCRAQLDAVLAPKPRRTRRPADVLEAGAELRFGALPAAAKAPRETAAAAARLAAPRRKALLEASDAA
ncbi:sigma-70 family RNA polymerase sigma factor [Azorhizobium doebereinerae]|uniref:sigma-70 family RNA polymerase sigma factor n=1 Tax=Azorhizobium doebereinerae TaxID=281091 RepID=UPI00041D40A0|nr:sigma-70 family RNA polymerase sigma factor [Azorhizobium doebereinerae]